MKTCTKCRLEKDRKAFGIARRNSDKLNYWCKECVREDKTRRDRAKGVRKTPQISEKGRECSKCREWKEWSFFHIKSDGAGGYASRCKQCSSKKRRGYGLARSFWNTPTWESAFLIQDGLCANLGCTNIAEFSDHDHNTNEPRALLCRTCNTVLGWMGEDLDRITGLLRYAEQCHNARIWL